VRGKNKAPRLPEIGQERVQLFVRPPNVGSQLCDIGHGLRMLTLGQLVQCQFGPSPRFLVVKLVHTDGLRQTDGHCEWLAAVRPQAPSAA